MKQFYFFAFFFIFLSGAALGQRVTATATIDKNGILIGEPAKLTLQANFPRNTAPSFFKIDSFAHFEVLDRSAIDTQLVADVVQLKQEITLTSWDSGAWYIPGFALPVRGVRTEPLLVQVSFSSPFDPNQKYHDIKDIMEVPNPNRETWYWYLVGALLLLLLFLLLFPKKKKAPVETVITPADAYKQAITQLEELRKNKKLEEDKAYYTELINIFRTYLHQSKGIHSFQKTTDDLSRQVAGLKMGDPLYRPLVQTLQLSDFVKYAKYTPTAAEKEESWEIIKKSIVAIEQIT